MVRRTSFSDDSKSLQVINEESFENEENKEYNLRSAYGRMDDISRKALDMRKASYTPKVLQLSQGNEDVSISMSKSKQFNLVYQFKNPI